MDHELPIDAEPKPPLFNYVISFLLVGVAWGFTTPFIRRAAADFNARQESRRRNQEHSQQSQISAQGNQGKGKGKDERTGSVGRADREDDNRDNTTSRSTPDRRIPISWAKDKITTLSRTVVNLLRTPAYSIPLVINLTGSIWFFLLVGKHELSLTVPLANSSAFLFTVLGEWYVERKVISMETWSGMALVLAGIGICVQAKS